VFYQAIAHEEALRRKVASQPVFAFKVRGACSTLDQALQQEPVKSIMPGIAGHLRVGRLAVSVCMFLIARALGRSQRNQVHFLYSYA
jgi:hypothetical protein